MNPLVRILPFLVLRPNVQRLAGLHLRFILRHRVTTNSGSDHLVGNRQTSRQQTRLRTVKLKTQPIVARSCPHFAIVKVFDVVTRTDNLQRIIIGGLSKRNPLGFCWRVVRFRLDESRVVSRSDRSDPSNGNRRVDRLPVSPFYRSRSREQFINETRLSPAVTFEQRDFVFFRRQFNPVGALGLRGENGEEVTIQRVQNFAQNNLA